MAALTMNVNNEFPQTDWPFTFYFNGVQMPKWGACWGVASISEFLHVEDDADAYVGHRDVAEICGRIDHVGVGESADADIFVYAVQEVLHILLDQRDAILAKIIGHPSCTTEHPSFVYSGFVEAAFAMNELAAKQRRAFWTSGYEADRERLLEVMRRCTLPADSPEFELPPHIRTMQSHLQIAREFSLRRLHQLGKSGRFDRELRRKLAEM